MPSSSYTVELRRELSLNETQVAEIIVAAADRNEAVQKAAEIAQSSAADDSIWESVELTEAGVVDYHVEIKDQE